MRNNDHPVIRILQKKVKNCSRCDCYFQDGRVEIHRLKSESIFVRIAKKIVHEKDFVADEFVPEKEFIFLNGTNVDTNDLDDLQEYLKSTTKESRY